MGLETGREWVFEAMALIFLASTFWESRSGRHF